MSLTLPPLLAWIRSEPPPPVAPNAVEEEVEVAFEAEKEEEVPNEGGVAPLLLLYASVVLPVPPKTRDNSRDKSCALNSFVSSASVVSLCKIDRRKARRMNKKKM
jgi:hypothetical protein